MKYLLLNKYIAPNNYFYSIRNNFNTAYNIENYDIQQDL